MYPATISALETRSIIITRIAFSIALLCFALLLNAHLLVAQTILAGQAFGVASVSQVRGTRAWITANQVPTGYQGIAGLTGICTTTTCSSSAGYWETGWGKGVITGNRLEMFVGYKKPNQGAQAVYGIAQLQDAAPYRYQTLYSNSAQRWEAWLGLTPKYYRSDMSFTSGNRVVCGGETLATIQAPNTPPLSDGCTETSYKTVANNQWTLHTLTGRQIFGPYCVSTHNPMTVYFYGPC